MSDSDSDSSSSDSEDAPVQYVFKRLPKFEKYKKEEKREDKQNGFSKYKVSKTSGKKQRRKCPICKYSNNGKISPVMDEFTRFAIAELKNKPRRVAYLTIAKHFNNIPVESARVVGSTKMKNISSSDVRRHFSEIKYMSKLSFLYYDQQIEFLVNATNYLAKRGCFMAEAKQNCDSKMEETGPLMPNKDNISLYLKLSDHLLKLSRLREADANAFAAGVSPEFHKRNTFPTSE